MFLIVERLKVIHHGCRLLLLIPANCYSIALIPEIFIYYNNNNVNYSKQIIQRSSIHASISDKYLA